MERERPQLYGRVLQVRNDQLQTAFRMKHEAGRTVRIADGNDYLEPGEEAVLFSVTAFGKSVLILAEKTDYETGYQDGMKEARRNG